MDLADHRLRSLLYSELTEHEPLRSSLIAEVEHLVELVVGDVECRAVRGEFVGLEKVGQAVIGSGEARPRVEIALVF